MAEINFSLLDPQTFYRGAANMNELLRSAARTRAGRMIATGDTQGAMRELNSFGDLDGANTVQTRMNAEEDRGIAAQTRQTAEETRVRAEEARFTLDAANALQRVWTDAETQGAGTDPSAATIAAWEQMRPLLSRRGIPQDRIAAIDTAIRANPRVFIRTMAQRAANEARRYTFISNGTSVFRGDNQTGDTELVGSGGRIETLGSAAGGQSLIAVDGSTPGQAGAPSPTAAASGPVSFAAPVDHRVRSGFGPRTPPVAGASGGPGNPHPGVDYDIPVGTPVGAIGDGVVIPDTSRGLGTAVRVRHADGTESVYGHLSTADAPVGTTVRQGQIIGRSGNTGITSGPNLHLGIYRGGVAIDPETVLGRGGATAPVGATPGQPTLTPGPTTASGGRVIATTPPAPVRETPHANWELMTDDERRTNRVPANAMAWIDRRTGQPRVIIPPAGRAAGGAGGANPRISQSEGATLRRWTQEVDQMNSMMPLLEEFGALNAAQPTGGMMAVPGASGVLGAVNRNVGRMNQITAILTPRMRQGLPGAASDRDVAMFRRATVSPENLRAVNDANIQATRAWVENQRAYVEFMEAYANSHGTIRGAAELWNRYSRENPLYAESGSRVNVRRRPAWRSVGYLNRAAAPPAGEAPAAPGASAPVIRYRMQGGQLVPEQ